MQASTDHADQHKKIFVLVTSLDGNLKHPFGRDDTVGQVRQFAYDHLVRQKDQIPMDRTWLEQSGQRVEDARVLASLVDQAQERAEPDLTLALVWETGGGR